jgi:hypothetical protein
MGEMVFEPVAQGKLPGPADWSVDQALGTPPSSRIA